MQNLSRTVFGRISVYAEIKVAIVAPRTVRDQCGQRLGDQWRGEGPDLVGICAYGESEQIAADVGRRGGHHSDAQFAGAGSVVYQFCDGETWQ